MRKRHKQRFYRQRLPPDLGLLVCAEKASRGNAFRHLIPALEEAERLTLWRGLRFRPRRCPYCGGWHVTADKVHKEES